MSKAHKHAELIKKWADGAEIEYYEHGWYSCSSPTWDKDVPYRIKPEVQYPCTRMSEKELRTVYNRNCGNSVYRLTSDIANTAIRRAIEDGDVILPNKD